MLISVTILVCKVVAVILAALVLGVAGVILHDALTRGGPMRIPPGRSSHGFMPEGRRNSTEAVPP